MARSIFSFGMFSFLPARMAVRKRGLEFGSPPPILAAIVISRITRVNARPRFASVAALLCLIVAHFECPELTQDVLCVLPTRRDPRCVRFCAAARHLRGS